MEDLLIQETNEETLGSLVEDDYNNIRYIGKNPNNYVYFNCKDDNNCETWRIIGLMDGIKTASGNTERLLKIIRENIGSYCWDYSTANVNLASGINEWSQADLMIVLNNDYFQSKTFEDHHCYKNYGYDTCPEWEKIGLGTEAQNMVEEVIWNTGTAYALTFLSTSDVTPFQYMWERSNYNGKLGCSTHTQYCSDDINRKTTWQGKVGLMYPSDYGYATDGGGTQSQRDICLYTRLHSWHTSDNRYCSENDWLLSNGAWTITPAPIVSDASSVSRIDIGGYVGKSKANSTNDIRPVVYLKSSVKIIGGDGSSKSPFQLKLEETQ